MMGIDAKVDVKAFDDVKVDYGDEVMLRTPNWMCDTSCSMEMPCACRYIVRVVMLDSFS